MRRLRSLDLANKMRMVDALFNAPNVTDKIGLVLVVIDPTDDDNAVKVIANGIDPEAVLETLRDIIRNMDANPVRPS